MSCRKQKKAVLCIIGAMALLLGCRNDIAEVHRLVNEEETGVERMHTVEILYSDSAVVRVQIEAPTLVRHVEERAPYEEFPDGVRVSFFNPLGKEESILTANYAIRYARDGRIIARDSVVWESDSSEKLETEELIWEEADGRIYSDKFVTIKRPGEIIYGVGFETDQDFTEWTIKATEGDIQLGESQQ